MTIENSSASASPVPGRDPSRSGAELGRLPFGLEGVMEDNEGGWRDIGQDLYQRALDFLELANPSGDPLERHRDAVELAHVGFLLCAMQMGVPSMAQLLEKSERTTARIRARLADVTAQERRLRLSPVPLRDDDRRLVVTPEVLR